MLAIVTATTPLLVACGSSPAYRASTIGGTAAPIAPDLAGEPTEPTKDLAYYLAQIPSFDPAPTPEPVWLTRYEGQAALAYEIPTDQPVAFITIDDGAFRHPMALDLIKAAKVPVNLFLTTDIAGDDTDFFRTLQETGYAAIDNHTIGHPDLKQAGYDVAVDELCGADDLLESWFGQRPIFFRPPFGEYDDSTLRAAWHCGLQAGFHWRETVDLGVVNYQRDPGVIHAGDIILMHFRPDFPDDFTAALNVIKNSGLIPARLEDYVRVGDGIPLPPSPEPTKCHPRRGCH